MKRIRDIVLAFAAIIVCASALVYNLAGWALPELIEIPTSSNLEARGYAGPPELSAATIADGRFQSSAEAFLSDHVPARDNAMLLNAALQRSSITASAAAFGFETYPTFFGSRYYVTPHDGLIVDRAEEEPVNGGGNNLEAWINTLNTAAQNHPETRFVYDCIARHDQTEANPTYKYYRSRLNPQWAQSNIVERLDANIASFVDSVNSYEEITGEWIATEEHWTLKRALKSYNMIAERLGLEKYAYNEPVEVVSSWYGDYARNGLDLDVPTNLEDLPIDFSSLNYYVLGDAGGEKKWMGIREDVLSGNMAIEPGGVSKYYEYYGGGTAEAINSARNNGKTLLFVGDSLSYCLTRFLASNYGHTVILLPGNDRLESSLESYIEEYQPDDVIVMMHVTKYEMVAEYSPHFMGLQ